VEILEDFVQGAFQEGVLEDSVQGVNLEDIPGDFVPVVVDLAGVVEIN